MCVWGGGRACGRLVDVLVRSGQRLEQTFTVSSTPRQRTHLAAGVAALERRLKVTVDARHCTNKHHHPLAHNISRYPTFSRPPLGLSTYVLQLYLFLSSRKFSSLNAFRSC